MNIFGRKNAEQAKQAIQSPGGGTATMYPSTSDDGPSLEGMIFNRLRYPHHIAIPFKAICCVDCRDFTAVFVAVDDKYVVIEDDKALFPSDNLLTKLRLLLG